MRYVTKTVDLGAVGSYEQRLTDHSVEIAHMRQIANVNKDGFQRIDVLSILVACDLLEGHDDTGLSLDNWVPVREFVETIFGFEILENGV